MILLKCVQGEHSSILFRFSELNNGWLSYEIYETYCITKHFLFIPWALLNWSACTSVRLVNALWRFNIKQNLSPSMSCMIFLGNLRQFRIWWVLHYQMPASSSHNSRDYTDHYCAGHRHRLQWTWELLIGNRYVNYYKDAIARVHEYLTTRSVCLSICTYVCSFASCIT